MGLLGVGEGTHPTERPLLLNYQDNKMRFLRWVQNLHLLHLLHTQMDSLYTFPLLMSRFFLSEALLVLLPGKSAIIMEIHSKCT